MIMRAWRNALRWRDLRAEHRQILGVAFIAAIGISSPLWFIAGARLYSWFELDPCRCVPIRDQPGGLLYAGALLCVGLVWIGCCSLASRAVVGFWQVRRGQLDRADLLGLVLGRYPDGWYDRL